MTTASYFQGSDIIPFPPIYSDIYETFSLSCMDVCENHLGWNNNDSRRANVCYSFKFDLRGDQEAIKTPVGTSSTCRRIESVLWPAPVCHRPLRPIMTLFLRYRYDIPPVKRYKQNLFRLTGTLNPLPDSSLEWSDKMEKLSIFCSCSEFRDTSSWPDNCTENSGAGCSLKRAEMGPWLERYWF